MAVKFAAALSAEMRRTLKQEIDTLPDSAMADFKQNDRANYDDFMDLVNDLLTFENEHGAKIYEDSFDEHLVVRADDSARETIFDVLYNGRPISTMSDSMKEASADALVKTVRRARFTPTATTFSFDSPAEFTHCAESEYRYNGVFNRAPGFRCFYQPGRWASDWENAPTPESTPDASLISSIETTPRTKELMVTIDSRWDIATANGKGNRREGVTGPMNGYDETTLRCQDDTGLAAAKKARHAMREKSKTFVDFIDSLPDPAGDEGDEDDFESIDPSAPAWSFDALGDSTLLSQDTEQHSSHASTKYSDSSRDDEGDCIPILASHERDVKNVSRKDFLNLQDDLADGMGILSLEGGMRTEAVPARTKVVNAPWRPLRRITAKIPPR